MEREQSASVQIQLRAWEVHLELVVSAGGEELFRVWWAMPLEIGPLVF